MPRVSQDQARLNRQRVVEAAAKMVRERGLREAGVADIMKAAGLTHGGFYNQFESKDALVAEAFDWALQQNDYDGLEAFVSMYLDERHVGAPGEGCPIAALANDITREEQGSVVRRHFTRGVRRMAERIAGALPAGLAERRRRKALATMSTMVGAIILARAVNDRELRDELVEAARSAVSVPSKSGGNAG
ncbi:TetR/AcrR family transcriptional regulator [Methylobacterium sp. ID0610]|uniref:TetR/AcrR family transcriptional regulator n=1 Tax=Methylobacterium carpenticola TaxID=3344827 RepID=UPI003679D079